MDSWALLIPLSICLCAALTLLFTFPHGSSGKKKQQQQPPSPRSLPLLGNLTWLRRPLHEFSPAIRRLAAEYGPILTLNLGIFPAIFIADRRLAHEALVVKGATFSDRPPARGANYIYSSNGHIVSSGRGTLWRLLRRNLTSEVLHPSRLRSYAPGRRWVLHKLLDDLRKAAVAGDGVVVILHSFRKAIFGLLVYMCFGEKLEDETIKNIEGVQRELLEMGIDLSIFDLMPRLAKFLLRNRWNRFLDTRRRQEEIFVPLIQERRRKKQEGGGGEGHMVSYVDTLLDLKLPEEGGRKLEDPEIVSLCSEFFNAGTDTTAAALQWTMANIVKFSSIQRRLFEEIGQVTGDGEEVSEEDLQRMPYLKAVILEALRRHPPAQFLLPHAVSEEVSIHGYVIPKGAAVNVTTAEFGWDEKVWNDPMEFKPERFMAGGEGEDVDITGSKEIRMIPFGAGRRICPGLAMAMLHLEYFAANIVKEFRWERVEGEEVDLSEVQQFAVTMKKPLRARIHPRKSAVE